MITLAILLLVGLLLLLVAFNGRTTRVEMPEATKINNTECCGAHQVCDKDTLLSVSATPEYFDDEELDEFAGKDPETYTEPQINMFAEVFFSLPEDNVAAWLRSLQLRNIQLPLHIKEQAFFVVGERRNN